GYENGREYIYDYYGHLHTHMPAMEQQVSGIVFKCKLHIQPRRDYLIIRATDIMFDKVHKDIVDFDEHVFNYRTIEELTEFMGKPFKLRYENGKVRNIQITRGEPIWSINMKKSIASVFNMDLEALNPIMPKDERFYADIDRGFGIGHELPTNYRIYEDGIYGECETLYDIQKTVWPERPYMNVLNVTKIKNYEHCRNTPYIFFGVKHGSQCIDCAGDKTHPVTSNAAYHYDIKGTRHNFIIERMMADGEIMYTPYTPSGNVIRILLNRTMTLIEIRDIRSEIAIQGDIITYNKLSYMFTDINEGGRMIDLKHAHQLVAAYGLKGNVDEVGRLFKNLVDFHYKDNEISHAIEKETIPIKFLEIIYSFVLLDYQQIDDFYHRFVEPGSDDYKEIFIDLLSVAGTNPAFMYSKYLIQSKKIKEDDSIEILRNMPFHIREPSEILFDEFYRLCEGTHVRDNHNIHSACLMAFSSLIYESCIVMYHNSWNNAKENAICTPTIAAKYFNYLVPQYERNLDEKERIMYIKVAGNFGIKEALPFLEKYAEDKINQFPIHIRMISIWVLSKAALLYPEKVRDIVLPIYRNWTESHEIRLAAFTILMRTPMDMALLKSIAAEIVTTEPNTQVISYVWSTFKHMAESDYPCHFEIAQHLRYVLPIIEDSERLKDVEEWPYSKMFINSGYEPEFDYGGFSIFSYIMANDSYIPRSMFIKMNDYMNNFNYDTFSATFDSWGLEPIFDKMFGPKIEGDVSPGRSLWNFFGRRRPTRDIRINKEVKEIDKNIHIETRKYPKPYAAFRITAFNNEILNMNLNQELFDDIMNHERSPMSILRTIVGEIKDFQVRTFTMGGDMSMFLPTEIGLPFYLEQKQPVFIYYKNKDIKFDVKGNEADGSVNEIITKINGHFMYDSHMIETASILVPFEKISVGVGYDSRSAMSIPIDIDVNINIVEQKFKIITHPQTPHEVFHYDFKPISFIESYENALPVVHEETRIEIFMEEDLHKFEREYFHDILGMGVKMSGHFLETPDFWGSWKKFWYSNDFRQKYYYITENPMWHPRKITIMTTPANRDITNEIEINMGWSWLNPETRGNKIYTSKHSAQIGDETFKIRDEARSYTSVIDLEMILRGQRERKIVSEIAYTRTRDLLVHHLNFFYDRTPFTMRETDNMKICFHGSMKFPPIEHDKFTDTEIPIDGTISTNFILNFGKDCKTDHKIVMKGIFEHTEEQKHLIETRGIEEPIGKFMKNPLRHLWKECISHRHIGISWNIHCDEYYFMASQLNRFIGDIEYENLSKEFMWHMINIRRHMRHMYFPWLANIEDIDITNPEGKIHMIANMSTWEPVMDFRLMLANENIHYKQAPVPMWFIPPRTYSFFEYTNLEEISSIYRHRVCDIQGPSIKTFDEVIYDLPETDCFKILAKDCSPNEHFMILGAKTKNPTYSKALRMFMHTFKIEIMPITEDGAPIVRVNGKKVPVTPEEPFRQFINTGVRDIEIFSIETLGPKPLYKIISDIFGIRTVYGGKDIFIQVAPIYRGKVCGLCGDYNLNKFHEFIGPDMCLHHNSTTFGNSYVIPSGECSAPEYRSPCTYPIGDSCTIMRTKIMEIGEGKNRQMCFSITPVSKCADSCIETRMISREVGFHCLPAKDITTRNLQQQAEIRPLTEAKEGKTQNSIPKKTTLTSVLQDIALTSTRKRTSKKNQPELTQTRPRTQTKLPESSASEGALIPLFRTNFRTHKRAYLHLVSCRQSASCIPATYTKLNERFVLYFVLNVPTSRFDQNVGFQAGKEYVYSYSGEVQVRNPEQPIHTNGVAFRSKVTVQPRADRTLFKVREIEMTLPMPRPRMAQRHGKYYGSCYLQMFRFYIQVERADLGKNEPVWSHNVKKGVLSLFQLDLAQSRRETPDVNEYKVKEEGLNGNCETLYVVAEKDHHLAVTKLKNLERCERLAHEFYGRLKGHNCVNCKAQQTVPLTVSSETKYELSGSRDDYVIQKASGESDQVFAPYGDGKSFQIHVHQALHLQAERDATEDVQLPEVDVHQRLSHTFPAVGEAHSHEDLQQINRYVRDFGLRSNRDHFVAGMNSLAQLEFTEEDYKNIPEKESPGLQFLLLFSDIVPLTYDEISEIYNQHVLNAPGETKANVRHLFLDLLIAAGNNPHVAFGLQLVKAGQLSVAEAQDYLSRLPSNLKEHSVAVLKELAGVCQSDFVKANGLVKSACVLALSALAGGERCIHAKSAEEEDSGLCTPSIVSHFFNYSVRPEDVKDSPEAHVTVYLKAAGNLATKDACRYLERFINPRANQAIRRRAAAFWSLTQAAPRNPELARLIALPVYENVSEPHLIRAAAFATLLVTNPDLYLLRHIAKNIINDPSDQLASFVTSAFRAFRKADFPCNAEMAQKLRYVVPLWDNVKRFAMEPGITKSIVRVSAAYDPKYDMGGMSLLSVIQSEDSLLPQSVYINSRHYIAGYEYDTFALGFEGWGVDKLLNALAGPKPGSTRNLWNVFSKRRFPRDTSHQERQKVEDALPILDRSYDPLYGRLTLILFGNTVNVFEFDESLLASLQNQVDPSEITRQLFGREVHFKNFYLSNDLILLVPTELGFPVFFDFKQADFLYGNRQAASIGEAAGGKPFVNYKRHYLYESRSYKAVAVALTFNQTSVGTGYDSRLSVSLPLHLEVTLDPANNRISMKRPLSLPMDVLNYHSLPYSFVKPYNRDDVPTGDAGPTLAGTPLYSGQELAHFDKTCVSDFLGYGLSARGQALKRDLKRNLHELWHEMNWRQKLYYLLANPKWSPRSLRLRLVPAEKDAAKSVEFAWQYKFVNPTDNDAPSSHKLSLGVTVNGENKTRGVVAGVTYSFSKDLLKHQASFAYEREAFRESDTAPVKVCIDTSADFPKPDWTKLPETATHYQGKKINVKASIYYGHDCVNSPLVSATGQYSHTEEDAEQIAANAIGVTSDVNRLHSQKLRQLYRKCARDKEYGVAFGYFCVKYLFYSSRLGKLTLNVDYNYGNSSITGLGLQQQYHQYHGHNRGHVGFLGIIASHMTGVFGKLHVVSQVPSSHGPPHADVVVRTPDGRESHHDHVPMFRHLLEPKIFNAFGYTNMVGYVPYYKHKFCDLQGNSAKTFDGVVVNLPSTDCFKVVARDCSANKRFIILARTLPNRAHPMELKMFILQTQIEVLPLAEGTAPEVRVDGSQVETTHESPYIHNLADAELFTISLMSNEKYEIVSKSHGIYVLFDGKILYVQVAHFYRGKLCGICGDYNYDRHHELVGPNLHLYNFSLQFATSYVVPSSDCTSPL
ncbi:unnamed protein product, partial [Ixodes hexagonus]